MSMGLFALVVFIAILGLGGGASACSDGTCKLLDNCSTDSDCEAGLYCGSCVVGFKGSRCIRLTTSNPFSLVNNSLPYNKYGFLTTHNSYAIDGEPSHTGVPRITFTNQEDTITQQLNNGARALMLDTYDFEGDVWLCHSRGGQCFDVTAFGPANDTMQEIEAFLAANPSEIVTLILEDYVNAPNGLTKVFNESGLSKYWFPLSKMPKNGEDWPLVSDMVAANERLLVFTSKASKEQTEGIAYQWNYMVENQYGDGGMKQGQCTNRGESAPLNDRTKSLVLVNYFGSIPNKWLSCQYNSDDLLNMLRTCYTAADSRWANFAAVDYYKRSEGGGAFQAVDTLNGKLLCGCDDIHACMPGSTSGACSP
ncbi:PI-PLC X domain-containing protein At5g67130 [Amborella trichopoda]|uniref:PI-PLC X domain-containing protein At5g67130 n=1 Tax=Amborella trichopoda TaxID=13333 RepID=UPI0009BD1832|nr:PI-PLC X domain-containing protein At5g67130 [Amborella trichopoda]|eukprot:XP_011627815.2 PI-PLC X domain-containing protein At5g67130 [Amborella trichopoda]